jgi:hypothetical protein
MKIPFTSIHYKPKYLVSHIIENYGDSVPVDLSQVSDGAIGLFRNIIQVRGPFFKETGERFQGMVIGENIEKTVGKYLWDKLLQ